MNDYKTIWNIFCDEVAASINNNHIEYVFEKDIAKDFFAAMDWNRFNRGLKEQFPVKFATVTHRADFALFKPNCESPEIIVELKRPKKKKEDKDAKQLIDYMRQEKSSFGILLLGSKMELYYIDYSTPEHKATLVETIKYQHDNTAALQLMAVLYRNEYSSDRMLDYCNKRMKINKSVEYWCSQSGKAEIMNMIIERSKLPEHLLDILRSSIVIDVKRKDGLNNVPQNPPIIASVISPQPDKPNQTTAFVVNSKKNMQRDHKVWMVPASAKFFDHKACFDELGVIYWKQFNNILPGDTGYIYLSAPHKRLAYKFEVIASDVTYTPEYDKEKKFYKNPDDYDSAIAHNRFYVIRKLGEHTSGVLSSSNMMQHGLKRAPQGTLNLSDPMFAELLAYIEDNF